MPDRPPHVLDGVEALTIDAYGTLLKLVNPVPALRAALREHGISADEEAIKSAFDAEAAYYRMHSSTADDEHNLERFRTACAEVFLRALEAGVDPVAFAPAYVDAMQFEVIDGVHEALERLRASGRRLAVVGNWDFSLRERLRETGLDPFFDVVVPAAGKPSPDGLLRALEFLGVPPKRALHVGDEPNDEQAARAAGMRFAPAPLVDVVAGAP